MAARSMTRLGGDGPAARTGGGGAPRAAALATAEVAREAVRLVVIERARDRLSLAPFSRLPDLLRAGDLVVVNDAATLPASLRGTTAAGEPFELRLSAPVEGGRLAGVVFGPGDHRTRTEDRPPPPPLAAGERAWLGAPEMERGGLGSTRGIAATVTASAGRRVELVTAAPEDALWQALYAQGAPVQYAHRPEPLPLWSVQTAYAARPWAAEMPSAGRPLTWDVLLRLRRAGVGLAALTHAAGLSSTGDAALDRALPWPERYEIPRATVDAIAAARARGGRVIAVGTTVVRALEAARGEAGAGVATLRIDPSYAPRVVDGLISGLHAPGESHFELLSAFAPPDRLRGALDLAATHGLSGHELGDACLVL